MQCYWFLVHLHVRVILHHLDITLPHKDGFNKLENSYIDSAYYSICDDPGINVGKIWLNEDWFYMSTYSNLCDG